MKYIGKRLHFSFVFVLRGIDINFKAILVAKHYLFEKLDLISNLIKQFFLIISNKEPILAIFTALKLNMILEV